MPDDLWTIYSQTPDYFDRLQRALDIKGVVPNVVDGHVGTSVQLLDLERVGYRYLARITRWQGMQNVGAVAGEFGCCQLVNPAGSNKLVTVTRLATIATAAALHNVWLDTTLFGGGVAAATRLIGLDSRQWGGSWVPSASWMVGTQAVPAPPLQTLQSQSTGTGFGAIVGGDDNSHAILLPGWALKLSMTIANTGYWVNVGWEERDLAPPER